MNQSRTRNSARNMSVTIISQTIGILMAFVSRTIFIMYLGNDYLSIQGLFLNILSVLSLAELGIGSAITYSLYKPISDRSINKISAIMNLFRKAYKMIAVLILLFGLFLIPFLKYIIDSTLFNQYDIIGIYILFLLNTVISYIYSYKKVLLIADQNEYKVTIFYQFTHITQIIIQIVALIYTKNYYLYLIIQIIFTLLNNILIYKRVDNDYPYLKRYSEEKLENNEKKVIINDIKSISFYKLGSVILTGTDNIIISIMLDTRLIGIASNYNLIISSINGIVGKAVESFAASIGNLTVTSESKHTKKVFDEMFLVNYWIYGFCAISLIILMNPFISLWLGENYLFSKIISVSLASTFFVNGMNLTSSIYRTTLGYFSEVKYTPIFAAIINVVLSLILAKYFGLAGVFFATTIARFTTFGIVDPLLIFKKGFEMPVVEYFYKYSIYVVLLVFNYIITDSIVSLIDVTGIKGFIIKAFLCVLITNLLFFVGFIRNTTFLDIRARLVKLIINK